jgi:putative tryptophan/tyrosine transport system substrate-binding protein
MSPIGTFLPCQPRQAMSGFQGQSSRAAEILRRQRLTQSGHIAMPDVLRSEPHWHAPEAQGNGCMKRREFIRLLGGAAATWPLAARAQQPERMRRIGVLLSTAADDSESSARTAAFLKGLQQLGWIEGRNLRIDIRWAAGDAELYRKYAAELVALAPDVILASSSPTVAALQAATRTVPIVFAHAVDPVGAGFVDSLARPGGNATGFVLFEYGISAKWLELLKEIAPALKRVAVLRDSTTAAGMGQFGAIQSVAPSFGMEVNPVSLRDPGEIERGITAFAASPNGGLIITAAPLGTLYRELIIALAARHKLPAIYSSRFFAADGGLVYYGPDLTDQYRRAAGYVDRILKGEKPANLAVQAPTKYELAINLKTARALGIRVPPSVLARADEVIE